VASSAWKSRFGVVSTGKVDAKDMKPNAVGWEKNIQNKLGPRVADLAPMMDPAR
jgi:ubiquitin-like modifier-activating enzyme ATG7